MKTFFLFFDIGWTLVYSEANDHAGKGPATTIVNRLLQGGGSPQWRDQRQAIKHLLLEQNHQTATGWANALKDILSNTSGDTSALVQRETELIRETAEYAWKQQLKAPKPMPDANSIVQWALDIAGRQHHAPANNHYRIAGVGIISNITPPYFQGACKAVPALDDDRLVRVLSYEQGVSKPNTDLYGIARERMSQFLGTADANASVTPVMIGDSMKNDIEPAAALKFATVYLPYSPASPSEREQPSERGQPPERGQPSEKGHPPITNLPALLEACGH
ncbi:MAG: HAD hydrolase-like protein [Alphaproteobacteria bacterium]|nr:HAD hydrolase-like protein [Alphaproteobacteria bacterium]